MKRLLRTIQCAKCPWKKATNPHDIPRGYCPTKHAKLSRTIAKPGDIAEALRPGPLRIMACHDEHETPCVGWMRNQLGRGNNLALRMSMRNCENIGELQTVGEQHETFENTLPT